MTTPITLRLVALTMLLTAVVDGVSISHYACNDTWNPTVDCNSKIVVKDVCQLHLRLSDLVSDSANGSTLAQSSGKSEHALLQLIVTSGIQTLRSTSLHGVDHWIVGSKDIAFTKNDETDILVLDVTITTPNICGQTFLIVRIIAKSGDTVELAIPLQLKCPEKQVDLALVGIVQEDYDVYNHKPVMRSTGQPISIFVPNFKLFVRNALTNTSYSARTGPSVYTVSAYIKPQLWNMYDWSVCNNSQQTVMHVDVAQLEYQVGDVMVNEGNRLVPTDGGRQTVALPGGSQTELHMENLVLNSKAVCGNGIMVVQLKVPHQPSDSNRINDFYFLPVFIDCWGHNPVETIETCEVIPNYYDGGQTAWITYTVPGQTKVYEYKSEERSIRALNPDVDAAALQDIALMKLTTDIQSDRLKQLGQCVTTMWGSSDAFVTLVDVLLTSIQKYWDEVEPKGLVQKVEHSKISLFLTTFSNMLTLALQPSNPLHNWLHVPFQWYFNPLVPYDSSDGSKHPVDTNQISRRKRDIDGKFLIDNNDEFEVAPQQKSPSQSNSISSSSANVSASTLASTSQFSLRTTTGLPPLTVTFKAATTGNTTKSEGGNMPESLSKGPLLANGGNGQSTARATTLASTAASSVSSTSRGVGSSSAPSSTAAALGATTATLSGHGANSTIHGASATASSSRGASSAASATHTATFTSATPTQGASTTVRAIGSPASASYATSSTVQTKTGANGVGSMGTIGSTSSTSRSTGSTGATSHAAGSTGTPVRATVSMASSTRRTESVGTTVRAAGPTITTARSAQSAGTTAKSAGSMTSTARGAGSSAASATSATRAAGFSTATTRGVESSIGSITSTARSAASSSSAAPGTGSVVTSRGTPTVNSATSTASQVTTKATMTTVASNNNLKTTAGTPATTKGSQTIGHDAAGTITTVSAGTITTKASGLTTKDASTSSGKTTVNGHSSAGQTSTSPTKMPTSTTANELTEDEKHFGPKPRWHEQVMEHLYELVKYSGKGLYNISPQRLQAVSIFLNTLLYGHKEDFERYSYIPKSTLDGLVSIMKMAVGQNLPRLFDNIPAPILKAVNDWMNAKYQRHIEVGNSACDFQEGIELALNVTQELLLQAQWQERKDQLIMLAHICRIFLKDDHTQYLSELYTRISAAHKMSHTWMIRDGIPIHEPDAKDVCQRYTAVKLWQLKTFPVFQFAGRTVSPDQYQSVFWSQERGTIFRGDRSELTGQVFWSKVATCSCPAGSTCGGNVANGQNEVNKMTGNSPVTGLPMAAAPLRAQVEEGIDLTNDDDDTDRKDSFVGFGIDEAEDMMFGE